MYFRRRTQVLRKTQVPPSGPQSCRQCSGWGFRMVLYYMTQLAVSRGKNCILGFRMKPHWFHKKLHTPISLHCKISVFFKPLWFHQELEYAICETILVSSEIGVCNKSVAATSFWPDGAPRSPLPPNLLITRPIASIFWGK